MGKKFNWKLAILALAALSPLAWVLPTGSAVRASEQAPVAQSSLELGPAFDLASEQAFEQRLTPADLPRLVRLKSRYALADAACPLPTDPATPFYVTFKHDLSIELANRLHENGVRFMGYIWQRTHIVRANDAESLAALGALLRAEPEVVGTLLQRPEDKLSRGAFDFGAQGGDFQILFWRDTAVADAIALLNTANADVLQATRDPNGQVDLNSPVLNVRVSALGFATLAQSNLLENIALAPTRYTDNQTSAAISNATSAIIGIAPYNLDGTDQIASVFDQGTARDTHEQFQNAPSPSLISNGTKRVLRIDTTGFVDHSTHCTGTIIGDGTNNATAKGYAPKAYVLSHNWNNVDQKRRAAKHNWNEVADSHSYASFNGTADDWGQYTAECQEADWTNRDFLLNMCQAAGNYATGGPGGSYPLPFADGSESVGSFNAHRNGFIIGSVGDTLAVSSFSSRGPCADGRLVPQFSANGESLTSPIATANNAYASYNGTSMATPSACGGLVLLSQLWRRLHSNRMLEPDTARSVLALTCQDRGIVGPDYQYGFGIVDVKAAADLMLADSASSGKRILRGSVHQGELVSYDVTVPASTPSFSVSCSWLDIYCNVAASVAVVNDLDLELVDPSNVVHYPYVGRTSAVANSQTYVFTTASPNRRDNIELCKVANPAAGVWKVRVRGFSVPANPQTGVPNAVTGFVLASSINIDTQLLSFEDALNTGTAVAIPDNNATGVIRSFVVSDTRVVKQIRVHARVMHARRGDVEIILESPLGTLVTLKGVNSGDQNTYTDVIGVFPDTRQYNSDVTALISQHVAGTWKVHVRDRVATNTGTLNYLALEFNLRVNNAPVASAGTAFNVRENANGQLNASASTDPDGDPLTYAWTQIAGTPTVSLVNPNTANPTFTAPSVSSNQVVTFQVVVKDASLDSDTKTVLVTILNNAAPVASAGTDVVVREGNPVALSAAGSSNAESDPMTYLWTQLSGATATMSGATTANASFNAPSVSATEDLIFQVKVTDDRGDFTVDTVKVTVLNNAAPTADAGVDASMRENSSIGLDAGASSDAESDPLTFAWTQTSGVTAAISGAATATPSVTAPSVTQDEILVFQVTVTDDRGDFTTDTVQVTVLNNAAPAANAGADFSLLEGAAGALDASASSNAETDPLTYAWTQTLGTSVTLTGAATATPTFTAPMVAMNEILEFEVTVTDDRGDFTTDRVQVSVQDNLPPVANAGVDLGLIFLTPGQLNGAASSDPNTGDTLTYAWTQTSGTPVVLAGATTTTPTFTAPAGDATLEFELTVTDSFGLTSTDRVKVYVNKNGVAGGAGKKKKGDSGGCSSEEEFSALWMLVGALAMLLVAARRKVAGASRL